MSNREEKVTVKVLNSYGKKVDRALQMDTDRLEKTVAPLLSWFAGNARQLPWREPAVSLSEKAYLVWVSEIMLQQTRVEAVKPFFMRFTAALPDVAALADCPEERLLKLWEGLGYYNRVRNMQKAARQVVSDYGGVLPETYEELLALPGIGSYTAGAVASIAYGQAVPAVDGNVLRVVSRICGNEEDISKQSVKQYFERELRKIMPVERPGDFNQSLMELGATVCLPNGAPECVRCPVRELCFARETGRTAQLPRKAVKKARRTEARTVLVIRDSERAALRKRPDKGLLAGLYELPNYAGHLSQDAALEAVRECGFSPIRIQPLCTAKHVFSHVEWQMTGYLILVEDMYEMTEESIQNKKNGRMIFVEPERTEREYPIPAAFAAYTSYLKIRLGQEKYKETEVQ